MFGWIGILAGVVFLLIAGFLIFFFPSTVEHQTETYGWNGVFLGFICGVIGCALIFLP